MRPLIIIRPQPVAEASFQRATALGLNPRCAPLFVARPLMWRAPDPASYEALFLSSAQSLRLGGPELERLKSLPVFAVGQATADAARIAGFCVKGIGDSDGQALIGAMEAGGIRNILWLCGESRSRLAGRLARLDPLPCYRMTDQPPPPEWGGWTAHPAVILAHSTRAAQRLDALLRKERQHLDLVAISAKVAAAAGTGWASVTIAARPDDAAMLAVASILCHKHSQ